MLHAFPSHLRNSNLRKNTVQSSLRWKAFSAVTRSEKASSDEKVLVIVESPAKARTIQAIMGKNSNFLIDSCAGHIRDLSGAKKSLVKNPESSMVFAPLRITSADLGVDVHNDFKPFYVPIGGKAEIIQRLKEKAKTVDRILLATDEDREGESISWHLVEVLKPRVPFQVSAPPFLLDGERLGSLNDHTWLVPYSVQSFMKSLNRPSRRRSKSHGTSITIW